MSDQRSGRVPAIGAALSGVLSPMLAFAAILSLTACATSQAGTPAPSVRVSASPVYATSPGVEGAVELEDDGIPVQTPPLAGRPPAPDDPREPFSPNYGRTAEALPWRHVSSPAPQVAETR